MNTLKNILIVTGSLMGLLFLIVIILYIYTFSGGISNDTINWDLFISICNWICISILTIVNIIVFYKLTTTIEKKDSTRFIENKISQTENSLRDIRIEYYQHLQKKGIELISKISSNKNYDEEFQDFYKQLRSMQSSILFSNTKEIIVSTIDPIFDLFEKEMIKGGTTDSKVDCIIKCLRGVEILILSVPLRDDRILNTIRESPSQFDPAFISIDNYLEKVFKK